MKKRLQKMMNSFRGALDNRRYYFRFARDEISARNLNRIHQCSMICIVMSALLFIITPIIFPAWHLSKPYLALFLFTLLTGIGSAMGIKREVKHYRAVMMMTVLFYVVLQLLLIYIDVVENQNDEAIFFPFMLIVLPIIQVLPVTLTFAINSILEIIFIVTILNFRVENLIVNDIYTSLIALVLSILVSNLVMNLRCEDNVAKFRYKKLSSIDGLTSTLNKVTSTVLAEEYVKARGNNEQFALLVLDVDTFKNVNDKLGHQMGDMILQKVGNILLDSFREEDIIGRVGGDEFMVVMKNIAYPYMVEDRCKEVNDRVRKLTGLHGEVPISCSIGVILIRNNHISFERCFSIADDALYEAKSLGRDQFVIREELDTQDYKKPVMIVADDDEINRAVVDETFREEYEIIHARDGAETLSYLSKYYSSVAVILLDICMPNMDGYQVIKYMKSRTKYKNIPIIVVSGYTENEQTTLELGVEDMIVKPFNPDVAKLRVANAVRMRKS